MTVSVVIPTRNRAQSLARTLVALAAQTNAPREIIIVDASDDQLQHCDLPEIPDTPVSIVSSEPSVCQQRNIGIATATGTNVLLCDDDIELPPDYIATLEKLQQQSGAIAVSGIVKQQFGNDWVAFYPVRSLRRLLFTYVFQLGLWGPVDQLASRRDGGWVHQAIEGRYRKRGNALSHAGWPLLTQVSEPVFHSRVYGLGASLIDRQFLVDHPFDSTLCPHGIGDNYDICLHMPHGVLVSQETAALHHQDRENRLGTTITQYRRILALDFFQTLHPESASRFVLLWSLCGLLFASLIRGGHNPSATWKAIRLIATRRNPYTLARDAGKALIEPTP